MSRNYRGLTLDRILFEVVATLKLDLLGGLVVLSGCGSLEHKLISRRVLGDLAVGVEREG